MVGLKTVSIYYFASLAILSGAQSGLYSFYMMLTVLQPLHLQGDSMLTVLQPYTYRVTPLESHFSLGKFHPFFLPRITNLVLF